MTSLVALPEFSFKLNCRRTLPAFRRSVPNLPTLSVLLDC
jgi:hypothetical protein